MSGPVLLVNPWLTDFAAYDLWARPLGLLTIASALQSLGLDVRFVDCLDRTVGADEAVPSARRPRSHPYGCGHYRWQPAPKPAALAPVTRRWKRYGVPDAWFDSRLSALPQPALALVGCTMTYWDPGAFEAIRRLKARWPDLPVLLGGIYPTLCPGHAAAHSGADEVVSGGGLTAALRAVGRFLGAELPPPAEPLCPDYGLIHHFGAAALSTTRGCPFRCTYCASGLIEPRFQRHDPRAVADVIEALVGRHAVTDVAFYDDALLFDAEHHALPLMAEVAARGPSVRCHTPNGLHARFITPQVAEAMRRAGFVTLRLSYESAEPARQSDSDGKVTTGELAGALDALRGAGFDAGRVGVYVLMGLPGQPEEEVAGTVRQVRRLGAQSSLAWYSPIPGTPEFERRPGPERERARAEPLLHNNTAFPCVAGPGCLGPAAYRRLHELSRALNAEIDRAPR